MFGLELVKITAIFVFMTFLVGAAAGDLGSVSKNREYNTGDGSYTFSESLTFSNKHNSYLMQQDYTDVVEVRDLENDKGYTMSTPGSKDLQDMAIDPLDGDIVYGANKDGTIWRLNLSSNTFTHSTDVGPEISGITVGHDYVYYGDDQGCIYKRSKSDLSGVASNCLSQSDDLYLSLTKDGQLLFAGVRTGDLYKLDNQLNVLNNVGGGGGVEVTNGVLAVSDGSDGGNFDIRWADNLSLIDSIGVSDNGRSQVARQGKWLYVAGNSITAYNTDTLTVGSSTTYSPCDSSSSHCLNGWWIGYDNDGDGWAVARDNSDGVEIYSIGQNNVPNKPTTASPESGQNVDSSSTTLKVNVSDPNGDSVDVRFYNASDDSLIGEEKHVTSGKQVSVQWGDFENSSEHSWYVKIDDGPSNVKSKTFNFSTGVSICDSRGPFNECIASSTHDISSESFSLSSIFEAESSAAFNALSGMASISVSNSTTLSGVWTGSFNISSSDGSTIRPGAEFKPQDGRIIIN